MTTPTFCSDCGHPLGVGRFCTNCGRPVPGRHPEAVAAPAVVPPVVPPSAERPPSGARYPLYADAPPTVTAPATPPPPPLAQPPVLAPSRRPARWVPWAVALTLLALVAAVGAFLLVGDSDGDRAADGARDRPGQTERPGQPGQPGEPGRPDSAGTGGPVEAPAPGDVVDLTPTVRAEVPAIAGPSRDRQGRPVRFVPANMWDGKARTSWRMAGDATGETLTFDLGSEVVITDVGMINGYAKVDGPTNWYPGNRRVRAVQWEFDDGTRVTQEFGDQPTMQMAAIGPVTTRTVRVHLLRVTAPGTGPNGRDFTAISEVRFLGAPG